MSSEKQAMQKASTSENSTGDYSDTTCVVCFKQVEIFSIGECDHPVCYECSTRMRVLCTRLECPICRNTLYKVVFTREKKPYRKLEQYNRSEYYCKKYRICFATNDIQKAFFLLLENPCPICGEIFPLFDTLKEHVRKDHELFYCDLCSNNLRLLPRERKCYTRQELALHRRKGDPDDTSHRGHPLCEYCDRRFVDRDELFRHLRRDHFYCHFCDADGKNQYYGSTEALRDHFRNEHYLCEEENCRGEVFTSVFRSEIDFKAHIANAHGKTMGKQQVKQARTLQLEITLGPRGRGQQDHTLAQLRSRGNNEPTDRAQYEEPAASQNATIIDARNEQEFPSLGGLGPSGAVIVPTSMSLRTKAFGQAGLARTKENFPALGSNGNSISDTGPSTSTSSKLSKPVSAMLKGQNEPSQKPNKSMVIHVSNRPSNAAKQIPNKRDFPALPGSSRTSTFTASQPSSSVNISHVSNKTRPQPIETIRPQSKLNPKENKSKGRVEDDFSPVNSLDLSAVSAKHRLLVDDYVSVAQPSSKISLVQKEDRPAKKDNFDSTVRLDTNDFPALAASSAPPETSWVKPQKQQEKDNRKSKVAPPPLLPSSSKRNQEKKEKKKNEVDASMNGPKEKKPNKSIEKKQPDTKKSDTTLNKNNETKSGGKQTKEKKASSDNGNGMGTIYKNKPKYLEMGAADTNSHCDISSSSCSPSPSSSGTTSAPPGFGMKTDVRSSPPPGFKSVTLNSIAKPANNMTFTNSLGENFSIVPSHQYLPPPESVRRNQELVHHFQTALQSPEAVAEFRFISQKFREGVYKPSAFFGHCQAALKDKFDDIFPELLVLLPDISKQQELFLVYSQHLNSLFATAKQKKVKAMLAVCKICKQIITSQDSMAHNLAHNLDNNFPTLNNAKSTIA